tara:strand:- start:76705 stop:76833 length:129 start_codon:yes stop_codon:yes gene_type:complete
MLFSKGSANIDFLFFSAIAKLKKMIASISGKLAVFRFLNLAL